MGSVVSFPVTPQQVTLNDPDDHFMLNSAFFTPES